MIDCMKRTVLDAFALEQRAAISNLFVFYSQSTRMVISGQSSYPLLSNVLLIFVVALDATECSVRPHNLFFDDRKK